LNATTDLAPTLELLRKILGLEIEQGYRNRSTIGAGIKAFFKLRFDQYDYDEPSWATAESILAYLGRYESAGSVEERARLAQVMLKKLDATIARYGETATATREQQSETGPVRGQTTRPPAPPAVAPAGGQEPRQEPLIVTEGAAPLSADRPVAARKPAPPVEIAPAQSLDVPAAEALQVRAQEQPRLEQLGISTLRSAVEYWPRDHYDFSAPVRINRMRPEMIVTLVGTLRSVDTRRTPNKGVQIVEAKVADPTGVMSATWFNQPFMLKQLKSRVGEEVAISGKVELFSGRLQLAPRDVEFPADDEDGTNTRRIVPVYPSSEGIAQRWLRRLISRALLAGLALVPDPLPDDIRRQFGLMDRRAAVAQYHFPASMEARDEARNRLALDELLMIQLGMLQRKRQWQGDEEGRGIPLDEEALSAFRSALPFTLTGAQQRSLDEILADMARPVPMSRLLQGDVGSGKTVVAAAALLTCARAGLQGAIMAPTEILAEQHARTLTALLEPHGVHVALLTGSVPKARRARIYLEALQGTIQVLVGTHALIQEDFKFGKLGLAIIDEQHRFGVVQRAALKGKGYNPHLLVMTATPIPRTLTLTLYGDLDVSVIDERPPHRQPVDTNWTPLERQAFDLVREQVAAGRQAFVICPLVEESENLEAKAAVAEGKRLQSEVFQDLRLEVLHGKMKPRDKEAVLGSFRDGDIDVLIATSVVEVGIDVPNATVMVVENADRFGLAQLHQFRGRVGRGAERSYCRLVADPSNPNARERLQALSATDDGFKLAEEDLRLRGPGEFWGTRQSGLPALQVAQVTDMPTLALARRVAEAILQEDPDLQQARHALLAESVRRFWDRAAEPS
jgi:ATP-dependent DNA helicase RecG